MVGPLLTAEGLTVRYGDIPAVRGIDFDVARGEIVVLLGLNGAGKSSTLNALVGLVPAGGKVTFADRSISGMATEDIVRQGIALVPEGRRVFPDLTVAENLHLGAAAHLAKGFEKALLDEQLERFPILKERYQQKAGLMSGGEQQMLAIGRALMANPRVILLDEPSLGLAPLLVQEIFKIIKRINEEQKTTILLVEQNANVALNVAHYAYIMENGRIVLDGTPDDLKGNADVREFYLGLTEVGKRKSYRDVKHYKRRKRWLS